MKKQLTLFGFLFLLFSNQLFASETWDILDKSMASWKTNGGTSCNKAWSFTTGSGGGIKEAEVVIQKEGYVNIKKMPTANGRKYGFLIPPALAIENNVPYSIEVKARMNPIDKEMYPDLPAPTTEAEEGGYEANQISARIAAKNLSVYIKYGVDDGYISLSPGISHHEDEKYVLNTSEWHVYRFVLYADRSKFDVYIDDVENPIFEGAPTSSMSGSNIIRLGAETQHRCDMDVESVKMGTGDFYAKPKILSVDLSSDSHVFNHARTISLSVNTILMNDGNKILASLLNAEGQEVVAPVEGSIQNNKAVIPEFVIPQTLLMGQYKIKVTVAGDTSIDPQYRQYVITDVSPLENKLLPQVSPVGFITPMDQYLYKGPSNEFIFPAIIDTKKYTVDGKFLNGENVLERYYRFYTPHEVPGGMYLATAPTLDGPWTERNTVIDLAWTKSAQGSNVSTADHISACQVIWNSTYNKYFMYFHGPNSTTHYATSDNLVDWTFGKSILNPQSFGTAGSEASYAKVFEYAIPGIGNKYILMLMIAEGNMRKIYWAHSKDGIDWICSKKPLVSPDLNYKKIPGTDVKPDYVGGMGNNVSGPFFMKVDDRCFVFFNGSSGNICVAEVGEALDMEVHWGEYMLCKDVVIDMDASGKPIAVPRIAAPSFIKDDAGKWYMFFEAGSRLGANIAYAKEISSGPGVGINESVDNTSIHVFPGILKSGELLSVEMGKDVLSQHPVVEIVNSVGCKVSTIRLHQQITTIDTPVVAGLYIGYIKADGRILKRFKIILK